MAREHDLRRFGREEMRSLGAGSGGLSANNPDAQRAGDLVAALFGPRATKQLSDSQRAARAWYSANGDRERKHTTGVWLRKPGRANADPVMVVRLDSNLLAQELGTNKDLYLARLASAGVRVSDLRFSVGRAKEPKKVLSPGRPQPKKTTTRDLTPSEKAHIEDATKDLPDALRVSVARAMRATKLRSE